MKNPTGISVVSYTKKPVTAEPADKYYDILTDIRYNLQETMGSMRELEEYFEEQDALKAAIEGDYDRMEKLTTELKRLVKKLEKKKVIRR